MGRPATASNGQIQRSAPAKDTLVGLLGRCEGQIKAALPKHVDAGRMVRIATTALRTVNNLSECTPASFMGCVLQAAQLGIEPNTPLQHAWLIPRRSKGGGYECTLVIGYQGMMELAQRSGMVGPMYAYVVRDGDEFSVQLGLEPDLKHVPSPDGDRESRPITYVYAVAKLKGGDRVFVALSRAQVEARRARSDGYKRNAKFSPWTTDEEAMFQKTALRALWKWLPKSAEMARASAVEDAADTGSVAAGLSDEVADALRGQGLEEPIDTTAEQVSGDDYDPATGELSPEQEAEFAKGEAQ